MTYTGPKKKILIVDDDVAMLNFMVAQLDGDPFDLVPTKSGKEAVRHIEAGTFDLVVLDVLLPDLNGMLVAQAIRKRHSAADLPILVISAHFKKGRDPVDLLNAWNVQGCMNKPLIGPVFRREVHRILGTTVEKPIELNRVIDLRTRYLADLKSTLADLLSVLEEQGSQVDPVTRLHNLEMGSHRIKGSAGSYGFPEISQLASQLETMATGGLKNPTKLSSLEWGRMRFLLDQMERKISQATVTKLEVEEKKSTGKTVYLGIDEIFIQRLGQESPSWRSNVTRVTTATETFHLLRSEQVDMLIIDLDHYQSTATDLIRTAKSIAGTRGFVVVCAGSRNDTTTRVLAGRSGADFYHLKGEPVSALTEIQQSMATLRSRDRRMILVVDDDSFQLDLLRKVLTDSNWTVKGLEKPEAVLETCRELQPSVVLLDQEMPGLKGNELCRALKLDGKLKQIPVVMLSAHDDEEMRLKALQAGAVDYIAKGMSVRELKMRIRNIVEHFAPPDLRPPVADGSRKNVVGF